MIDKAILTEAFNYSWDTITLYFEAKHVNVPLYIVYSIMEYSKYKAGPSSQEIIDHIKTHDPLYAKYANDVDKYLILI